MSKKKHGDFNLTTYNSTTIEVIIVHTQNHKGPKR